MHGSCAIVVLLLAAAWAAPHDRDHMGHTPEHYHHLHHGPQDAHQSHKDEDTCQKLVVPNANFAFALYKSLSSKAAAGKNVFFSPLGVATALSMLSTGGAGVTHSQLFAALGYGAGQLTQAQVDAAYEHLLHMLSHGQEAQQLSLGNALAIRNSFKPAAKFLEDVKHYYASEAFSVNFSAPAVAAAKIDEFITQKTQGKINYEGKDLSQDTVMVLINYVFFRGEWEKQFDATNTKKGSFQVDEATAVEVDMMRRTGRYEFYEDYVNHTTVILLPYKSNTSMLIVLPGEGKMDELEGYINKEYLEHWHDSLDRRRVALLLPKFSISAEASLDGTLQEMGITDAFGGLADFSGISEETKLQVSKIIEMHGSCAIVVLLLAAAWAAPHAGDHMGHTPVTVHDHHLHHGPQDAHQSHQDENTCQKLVAPNANFAFALYKSLSSKAVAGKNVFFSPLGVATALSMLSTGAAGVTHSQLFAALGYGAGQLTQAQVDAAYEHLLHMLSHGQEAQQLSLGNALAIRDSFKPAAKFLEDVKHYYASEAFSVDFSAPAAAAAKIDEFITQKTQGKINYEGKDLSQDTVMVLINYVFFRGKWEKQFDATNTKKGSFQVDEATAVEVDMMRRTGRYEFYQDQDNHTTVILLPYKSNTSMLIVLPDEGKMEEVEGYINKEYLEHWHDSLDISSVDLLLPKFSISAEASLGGTLQEMGITDAFGHLADFSGISETTNLKVSKVSHKAVLSVDETGTEAAASTTIEIMPMSMPDTMDVNRPFLVFILEHSTKSILFMGKISNPTLM